MLPLAELVPSLLTSAETIDRAQAFAGDALGKRTVLSNDRAGFVVNALLIPYLLAAIRPRLLLLRGVRATSPAASASRR